MERYQHRATRANLASLCALLELMRSLLVQQFLRRELRLQLLTLCYRSRCLRSSQANVSVVLYLLCLCCQLNIKALYCARRLLELQLLV